MVDGAVKTIYQCDVFISELDRGINGSANKCSDEFMLMTAVLTSLSKMC